MRTVSAAALLVLLLCPQPTHAQLNFSNILEARSGYDPFRFNPDKDRAGVYDQFSLDYFVKNARFGFRFELERDTQEIFDYADFTLRYAEWDDRYLRARVGNFYTILGRGLVHRSFEIGGVVIEQPDQRSRFGLSRDVDGVLLEVGPRLFKVRWLAGKPNGGTLSPGVADDRHIGTLLGGQAVLSPVRGTEIGATYSRFNVDTPQGQNEDKVGSGFVGLDPLRLLGLKGFSLPLYVEYAIRNGTFDDWWQFESGDSSFHALYASLNFLWGPLAISAEWKDYLGFRLGTNDPPSLVPEYSQVLLNRTTHVLDADDEEGYQLQASWSVPNWGSFTTNLARSDGSFGPFPARYDDNYLEINLQPTSLPGLDITPFTAWGKNEFDAISQRTVYGIEVIVPLPRGFSVIGDYQRLDAPRQFIFLPGFEETFADTFPSGSVEIASVATF
jgi:hypothetical protein